MSKTMESKLNTILENIAPLDEIAMEKAQERLNHLTKPPESLGALEAIAKKIAGITGHPLPALPKKAGVLMAADHGVVEEDVSAFPQEVTAQMVLNFVQGGAAINVLSEHVESELSLIDIGVAEALEPHPGLLNKKVAYGTSNMTKGPAMTRIQALKAMNIGFEVGENLNERGVGLLATGEMGIGNTTPSAALAAFYSGYPIEKVVGRGTGIDDNRLKNKISAIEKAIKFNQPDKNDPLDVLSKIGGLEIAGLTGVTLAAASHNIPVMIDGVISGAAGLVASEFSSLSTQYMLGSHYSKEPGHGAIIQMLGIKPILDMDMRLGEGTGAVLAMNAVDASIKIIHQMATFSQAGIRD